MLTQLQVACTKEVPMNTPSNKRVAGGVLSLHICECSVAGCTMCDKQTGTLSQHNGVIGTCHAVVRWLLQEPILVNNTDKLHEIAMK